MRQQEAKEVIGPIFPVGSGSISPPGIVPTYQSDSAAAAPSGRVSLDPTGGSDILGNSQAIADVFAAVSGMLSEIGGGLEDDKVLQALIALLILMALLQGALEANGSPQSSRGGNGIGSGNDPLLFASSYTKTTIFIEQTSVTSTFQMPADSATSFDAGQPNTLGGAFDSLG